MNDWTIINEITDHEGGAFGKNFLNKWVLRAVLKIEILFDSLMVLGRLFQSLGPCTANARPPKVVSLYRGMVSSPELPERSGREGTYCFSNCFI